MLALLLSIAYAKAPEIETTPDPRAAAIPDTLASQVKSNPDAYAQALVDALIEGTSDQLTRVRRLHDWVALNIAYDAPSYLAGSKVDGSWSSTLRSGSAVCQGYANLFSHLLDLAAVENRVVSGYARGFKYDPFHDETPLSSNHAWNQVRIGGQWFLVDVTWDAGGISDDGAYKPQYSTRYFLADPAVFVRTHLPAQPTAELELLAEPVDAAKFAGLPPIKPPFGSDLVLLVPSAPHTVVYGMDTMAVIHAKIDARVTGAMVRVDGTKVAGAVLTDRVGDTVRMRIRFPEPGDYVLNMFTDGNHSATLAYTARTVPLPKTFSNWRPDFTLVDPTDRAPGTAPQIVLALPGVGSAVLVVDGHATPMVKKGARWISPPYDQNAEQITVAMGDTTNWTDLIAF